MIKLLCVTRSYAKKPNDEKSLKLPFTSNNKSLLHDNEAPTKKAETREPAAQVWLTTSVATLLTTATRAKPIMNR